MEEKAMKCTFQLGGGASGPEGGGLNMLFIRYPAVPVFAAPEKNLSLPKTIQLFPYRLLESV